LAITSLVRDEGLKYRLSAQQVREAMETSALTRKSKTGSSPRVRSPQLGLDARIARCWSPLSDICQRAQVDEGRVDFRDRGSMPTVEKGMPIAVLHLVEPGQPGRNVIGELIKFPEVRVLHLRKGKGVTLEKDDRMVRPPSGAWPFVPRWTSSRSRKSWSSRVTWTSRWGTLTSPA